MYIFRPALQICKSISTSFLLLLIVMIPLIWFSYQSCCKLCKYPIFMIFVSFFLFFFFFFFLIICKTDVFRNLPDMTTRENYYTSTFVHPLLKNISGLVSVTVFLPGKTTLESMTEELYYIYRIADDIYCYKADGIITYDKYRCTYSGSQRSFT